MSWPWISYYFASKCTIIVYLTCFQVVKQNIDGNISLLLLVRSLSIVIIILFCSSKAFCNWKAWSCRTQKLEAMGFVISLVSLPSFVLMQKLVSFLWNNIYIYVFVLMIIKKNHVRVLLAIFVRYLIGFWLHGICCISA